MEGKKECTIPLGNDKSSLPIEKERLACFLQSLLLFQYKRERRRRGEARAMRVYTHFAEWRRERVEFLQ
jgi:hypothetical protein